MTILKQQKPVTPEDLTAAAEGKPEGDFRGPYGYGRPAHKSDPNASYGFEPEIVRPLPIRDHLVR